MKPKIKKAWVNALRSGKYKQGRHALSFRGRHCCLGVLCELAVAQGALTRREAFLGNGDLNFAMKQWAQCGRDPELKVPLKISQGTSLGVGFACTTLNDDGAHQQTFKQIAKYIEATPARDI